MPFKLQTFQESVERLVEGATRDEIAQVCQSYTMLTTPQQKARCIQKMIDVLDREVDAEIRYTIMEECGRRCIGANTLQNARRLQKDATDLDS